MGLFNRLKEPVMLKESSDAQRQLDILKELEPRLTKEGQEKIRQDIRCLEYGIQGENQIAFELKNSHMPMYILHDIYIEDGDLSAQIDYLVVTKKICFVIECKNLYGNIEINSNGDFIRTVEYGGRKKREGIYSPITQNERHLELLKKIKTESRGNVFTKLMAAKYFSDFHKAIVVLANPKTVLNDRYAKKEIKNKVIRADQLVAYIKEQCRLSKELEDSDEKLKAWAESFLKLHKEVEKDYTSRYQQYMVQEETVQEDVVQKAVAQEENEAAEMVPVPKSPVSSLETDVAPADKGGGDVPQLTGAVEDTALFQELRAYRLKKSREENVKPYFLYNDNQLKDLIAKMPTSKTELQSVAGFGPVKVEKYGDAVLEIIARHQNG